MIEWMAEVGAATALILLIASVYAYHIQSTSLLVVETRHEVVRFIGEAGLVATEMTPGELAKVVRVWRQEYSQAIDLWVQPALNISFAETVGALKVCALSWSGTPLPANVTMTRVRLGQAEPSKDAWSFSIGQREVGCTAVALQPVTDSGLYFIVVDTYGLKTFRVIPVNLEVRDNYDPESEVLYNSSSVRQVYALIAPGNLVPAPIEPAEGGVRVHAEPGTVALIVYEEEGVYMAWRIPLREGDGFRGDLNKYVVVEGYALLVSVGAGG